MKDSSFPVRTCQFHPYSPPNEGAGLITVDRDLCWRINARGLVTPAVIGAVCWARNNFTMSKQQHQSIVDGLGLEYKSLPGGATVLGPQEQYCRPRNSANPGAHLLNLTTPQLPLHHYDAVEVYGCIGGEGGIHRFEANEHPEGTLPQFWSVALHLQIGHIETIADFPKENHAETFGLIMTDLIRSARQARGLDTSLLYAV
ncbi:MAG: hypothetical protein V4646_16095 [Pseudomonadota bacterium]